MLNRLTAVFLIFAQTVLGEETPNLRGRPENSLELESSTPANEAHNPKSSEEFMNKIFHNLKSKLRSEEANNAAGKSELSVNPQFTYGGYLIVRQRSYANKWNECSGPGN